jgi:hypothetical protein
MGKEEEKREGQISLHRWGCKPPSYFYFRWRQVKKWNKTFGSEWNETHAHRKKKPMGFLLERIRRRRRKNLCVCVYVGIYCVWFLCERVQEKVGPPRGVGRPKMLRALCCCCSSCRGASTRCTGKCINSLHFKVPRKQKQKGKRNTKNGRDDGQMKTRKKIPHSRDKENI